MRKALIVSLVIVYLLAIPCVVLPEAVGVWGLYYLYFIAGILIIHVIEIVVFFKHVKNYPGSFATSILLTIAFGFLHWLPYKK